MGLQIQTKLSAYFKLQGIVDLLLFNVNLKQNFESQHKGALSLVDGTKITSSGAIRTWMEMSTTGQ